MSEADRRFIESQIEGERSQFEQNKLVSDLIKTCDVLSNCSGFQELMCLLLAEKFVLNDTSEIEAFKINHIRPDLTEESKFFGNEILLFVKRKDKPLQKKIEAELFLAQKAIAEAKEEYSRILANQKQKAEAKAEKGEEEKKRRAGEKAAEAKKEISEEKRIEAEKREQARLEEEGRLAVEKASSGLEKAREIVDKRENKLKSIFYKFAFGKKHSWEDLREEIAFLDAISETEAKALLQNLKAFCERSSEIAKLRKEFLKKFESELQFTLAKEQEILERFPFLSE